MPCKLIKLEPKNPETLEKIKINDKYIHGDLVIGKDIFQSGLYVIHKIGNICNLIDCDTREYFPRVCNVIPETITQHIKDPYKHYKKYFSYIQEINLNPSVHYDIINKYITPNLKYKYKMDSECLYVTKENNYTDSYDIKTLQLTHSNIAPFSGY